MDYCQTQVARQDRDRFILTLGAPAESRPALWALYAFNFELAKTREVTQERAAGHIRLAWWRDRIADFYAGAPMPAHDVARALGGAILAYNLPREPFEQLIDARALDLDGGAPATLEGLIRYADAVNTPLLQLTGAIIGAEAPEGLGAAWGLTGIIRALPFFAAQNRCVLPLPMLYDLNLMPEQFHHLSPSPALSAAVSQIAQQACAYLDQAQSQSKLFRVQIKMTRLYLKSIEKSGCNPFALKPVPFLALRVLL